MNNVIPTKIDLNTLKLIKKVDPIGRGNLCSLGMLLQEIQINTGRENDILLNRLQRVIKKGFVESYVSPLDDAKIYSLTNLGELWVKPI